MIKSRFVAGTSNSSRSRLRGDGGGQARFAAATMPPHRHGAGIEGEVLVALADPHDAIVFHCLLSFRAQHHVFTRRHVNAPAASGEGGSYCTVGP